MNWKKSCNWIALGWTMCFLLLIGCSGGTNNAGVTGSQTFSGPGSYYNATLNEDGTFTITVANEFGEAVHTTVNGSYALLENGFLLLTVTDATSTEGEAPAAGEQAYGLFIPGYALIIKPLDGDEVIPMLIAGDCPDGDFNANWIIAQNSNDQAADDPARDWFGRFAYDADTDTATLPAKYNLVDFSEVLDGDTEFADLVCSDGFMQILNPDDSVKANMWLTANGGAIVEAFDGMTGERHSSILATPQQAVTLADMAGDYAGIVIDGSSVDEIFPIGVTLEADGTGTGASFEDFEANILDAEAATLALGNPNVLGDGWVTGTVTSGLDVGNIACSVTTDVVGSGKNMILCNGQSPGNNADHFIVLMVSE